ncbi:MAG: tRNA (adenosine(37)-N6)-threonylcarbamoyltransferase complex ATPase subunit type 1 TsaE [Pseudomonadota bacterium]
MTSPGIISLPTLDDTLRFGRHLGRTARPGDIFTLSGDLGAGKTTLTQAIGQGIEVPPEYYITSPTFSLLHEYPGRIPLYHMDLYRLGSPDEIEELGFEDYIYGNGLTVIEWPDRLEHLMPPGRLDIRLSIVTETSRSALLNAHGEMLSRLSSFLSQ